MNNFDIFYLLSYTGMMGGILYYAFSYLNKSLEEYNYNLKNTDIPSWFNDFLTKYDLNDKDIAIMVDKSPGTIYLLNLLKNTHIEKGYNVYTINTSYENDLYLERLCTFNNFEYIKDVYNSLYSLNLLSQDEMQEKYNMTVIENLNIDNVLLTHNSDYFSKNIINKLFFNSNFSKKEHYKVNNINFYCPLYNTTNNYLDYVLWDNNYNYEMEQETIDNYYFNHLDTIDSSWRDNLYNIYIDSHNKENDMMDDIDTIFDTLKIYNDGGYIKLGNLDHIPLWLLELIIRKFNIKLESKKLQELYTIINNTEMVNGTLNDQYKFFYKNGFFLFYDNYKNFEYNEEENIITQFDNIFDNN